MAVEPYQAGLRVRAHCLDLRLLRDQWRVVAAVVELVPRRLMEVVVARQPPAEGEVVVAPRWMMVAVAAARQLMVEVLRTFAAHFESCCQVSI